MKDTKLEEARLRAKVLVRRADHILQRIRSRMVDITDFSNPEWMGRDRSELCALAFALDLIDEHYPGAVTEEQINKLCLAAHDMKEAGKYHVDHVI